MSSASLIEKRTLRKSQSRIGTSSTSITSAPPTTSDSKKHDSDQSSAKEKSMRSKQRDSLPELRVRKGNRSVRASNFELSSSANDFESRTNHHERESAKKPVAATTKTRTTAASNQKTKSDTNKPDDKVMEMLKMDSMAQENYKSVYFDRIILYFESSRNI